VSNIAITQSDLLTFRVRNIIDMFSHMSIKKLKCDIIPSSKPNIKFFAITDSKYDLTDYSNYREWTFRIRKPKLLCGYNEIWKTNNIGRFANNTEWYLDSANFYLHKIEDETSTRNLLMLHSEPNNTANSPAREFKESPHIHIECAEHPFPKGHIPLKYGQLDIILASLEELTKAIEEAVFIVEHEFIDRL